MDLFGGYVYFGRGKRKKAFFRISGNIMSAHAGESYVAENIFSLCSARVALRWGGQIVITLEDGRVLRFFAENEQATKVWFEKLKMATSRVFLDSYTLHERIAEGGFAVVNVGRSKASGAEVAVKIMQQPHRQTKSRMHMENEIKACMSISHRNIVKTYDIFDDGTAFYIVMERVRGGTLEELVQRRGQLTEGTAARISRELLAGLQEIHSLRIIHRDIKAENVLLVDRDPENVPIGEPCAKIIDFGLCSLHKPSRDKKGEEKLQCGTFVGSCNYLSPEQARREIYGTTVDVWAAGINIYYMIMGSYPFPTKGDAQLVEVLRVLRDARIQYKPEWFRVSEECRLLVDKMLNITPSERPAPEACLRALWFRSKLNAVQPTRERGVAQSRDAPNSRPPSLDGLVGETSRLRDSLRLVTQGMQRKPNGCQSPRQLHTSSPRGKVANVQLGRGQGQKRPKSAPLSVQSYHGGNTARASVSGPIPGKYSNKGKKALPGPKSIRKLAFERSSFRDSNNGPGLFHRDSGRNSSPNTNFYRDSGREANFTGLFQRDSGRHSDMPAQGRFNSGRALPEEPTSSRRLGSPVTRETSERSSERTSARASTRVSARTSTRTSEGSSLKSAQSTSPLQNKKILNGESVKAMRRRAVEAPTQAPVGVQKSGPAVGSPQTGDKNYLAATKPVPV